MTGATAHTQSPKRQPDQGAEGRNPGDGQDVLAYEEANTIRSENGTSPGSDDQEYSGGCCRGGGSKEKSKTCKDSRHAATPAAPD